MQVTPISSALPEYPTKGYRPARRVISAATDLIESYWSIWEGRLALAH